MTSPYEIKAYAGWGDMDANAHMKNTAYLDKSADMRMRFFAENGFPMAEFTRLQIGPVVMKEDIAYRKEIRLLEEFTITLAVAGLTPDGGRFRLRNEFLRHDGNPAAQVTSFGGWLDLSARKLTTPPAALLHALRSLPKTPDFAELDASLK